MLSQQPNVYVKLSKGCQAYNANIKLLEWTCRCIKVCFPIGMCVYLCIDWLDQALCISLASCLDARLAAQRKMISRPNKYCLSAIDGPKCTNSVFWRGVEGRG